jgi:hypothetical protein
LGREGVKKERKKQTGEQANQWVRVLDVRRVLSTMWK